jgi:cytochrome c553
MSKFLMIGIASLAAAGFCAASSTAEMGDIYKNRCANCHGVKANGVPKLSERTGVKPEEANMEGIASQEKLNIYGPPLNTLSKSELTAKLRDFKSGHFDSESFNSQMRKNLKKIEAREGEIDSEKMAEYISKTFGK